MEAGNINIKDFLLAAAGTIGENLRHYDDNSSSNNEEEEEDLGPPVARIPPVDDNIAVGQDIEVGDPGVEDVINLLEEGEGDYTGPNLLNYRSQPIALDIQGIADCPSPEFVANQIRELEVDFLNNIEESLQHNSPLPLCLLCLKNTASRLVVPCGHLSGCAECTLRMIRVPTYLHVQGENEDIIPLRLPIRCALCKCLVGKLIRAFLY
ncbi:uncharacterized protein LOC111062860 isoform X2 [Nilaparvata lugens]|uniref:uncharacterized protein LOC111062860 isoform X2 n=1 Tax=Nilaparvata lugens TaxID=108931 RepID=UPI00193D094C|nr:uncharacterized protein LOC111062860 isoform X2 [Nilaparvata lugens]